MVKSADENRDIYYRRAKEVGFRARSAFKLLQLNEQYKFLDNVDRAVDLCAAPGSWSQVLSDKLYDSPEQAIAASSNESVSTKIISIDLQEIAPIPGVTMLQGDITSIDTANEIISHFQGSKAQLVICDGAPDVTGVHDIDEFVQHELLTAALNITTHILDTGGVFVAKIFRYELYDLLEAQLRVFFKYVTCVKPSSSRIQSNEAFVVCEKFELPKGYIPVMTSYLKANYGLEGNEEDGTIENYDKVLIPFLSCGDLSGYDDLKTYE